MTKYGRNFLKIIIFIIGFSVLLLYYLCSHTAYRSSVPIIVHHNESPTPSLRMEAAYLLANILRDLRNSSLIGHNAIGARLKAVANMLVQEKYQHFREDFTLLSLRRTHHHILEKNPSEISEVTVLINMAESKEDNITLELAKSVRQYNKFIPIILAVRSSQRYDIEDVIVNNITIKSFIIDDWTPGAIWNSLVTHVKSKFVLVTKDLVLLNGETNFKKQIEILKMRPSVGVVSGSTHNVNNQRNISDCYQTQIRNYVLKFTKGYQHNIANCMICDYVKGPFLARTSTFQIPLSEDLPDGVLFEDWFLRLKQNNVLVVNCPDVLYYTNVTRSNISKVLWLSLALQWDIVKVEVSENEAYTFSCKELHVSCDTTKTNYHLIPLCCLKQYGLGLSAVEEFAVACNTTYELESGSTMGAVKFRGLIPWDIDGDLDFLDKVYDKFHEKDNIFKSKGLKLKYAWRSGKRHRYSYIVLYTPDISIELFGEKFLSEIYALNITRGVPTKTEIVGEWIRNNIHPGLYCRNRYGYNYLKHAQSWTQTNLKSAWAVYKPGHFHTCPETYKHSCLDQYPTDGNLDFDAFLFHYVTIK